MNLYHTILTLVRASFFGVAFSLMLGGCGMKGPLYHPKPAAQPAAPTSPDAQPPARHSAPAPATTSTDPS